MRNSFGALLDVLHLEERKECLISVRRPWKVFLLMVHAEEHCSPSFNGTIFPGSPQLCDSVRVFNRVINRLQAAVPPETSLLELSAVKIKEIII